MNNINSIISDVFKFSQNVYEKSCQGMMLATEEFCTQTWNYDNCTVFIRVQNFNLKINQFEIFMQLRNDGLIVTNVFPYNISLADLKKLVKDNFIKERDVVKRKLETINNLIKEL